MLNLSPFLDRILAGILGWSVIQYLNMMICGSTDHHLKRNIFPTAMVLRLSLQFTNLKGLGEIPSTINRNFRDGSYGWQVKFVHVILLFLSDHTGSWSITSSPSLSGGSSEGIGTGSSFGIFSRGTLPGPSFDSLQVWKRQGLWNLVRNVKITRFSQRYDNLKK